MASKIRFILAVPVAIFGILFVSLGLALGTLAAKVAGHDEE